jgi:hypothetical protein
MPQNKISITIYNSANSVVEQIKCRAPSTVTWSYEMFDGMRTLDLTTELKLFIESGASYDKQQHALFCTYIKFGEAQQERADFTVVFER